MTEEKKKDSGMKWVIVADILIAIVVGLLVFASYVEKKANKEIEKNMENAPVSENLPTAMMQKSYNFDLELTKENCENVKGDVDIVLISDGNYMEFTRVAIQSAKRTKCENSTYNFYVMTMDLKEGDDKALKDLEEEGVKVTLLPQEEIDLFYIRDTHVSKTALLKYYIANVLPELDKVLYIDSDVLVLHDLNELFNTDIENKYLAVVKDPSWFFENGHVLELNLEERGFYFNSGVMLMNLKKIRDDGLVKKLEDYTNNNFRTYMDQDAFNVEVGNDVVLLDVKYNTMNFFFEHNSLKTMADFYGKDWKSYEEVFAPAVILHFASSKKFFYMLQKLWHKYYKDLKPLEI